MTHSRSEAVARPRIELEQHGYPGRLIVVEGLDGAGKTTFIRDFDERLRAAGQSTLLTRQPTTAARESDLFTRFLYDPDQRDRIEYRALLALMLSDRLQHVFEVVRPALAAGIDVICDRYIYTMIATMRARGYEESWLLEACRQFLRPDYALLLDAPFEMIAARISERKSLRDSYIEDNLYRRTQEEFWLLAQRGSLDRVDSVENTKSAIVDHALSCLSNTRNDTDTTEVSGVPLQSGIH